MIDDDDSDDDDDDVYLLSLVCPFSSVFFINGNELLTAAK